MKSLSKYELNFLNVLFCLLVILIHLLAQPVSQLTKGTWQYAIIFLPWRLSSFVVQGFILISAVKLFLKYRDTSVDYLSFLKSRFNKIIIPYILWVLIYYLYFCNKNYFSFNITDLLHYLFIGNLVSHFYFVIIIVQFYLLLPIWLKLLKKYHPIFIIPLALLLTMLFKEYLPTFIKLISPATNFSYTDRVFTTYLAFWIIGGYIGLYYEKFKALLLTHKWPISIQFILMLILEGSLGLIHFSGIQTIPFLEDLHLLYILSILIFLYLISYLYTEKLTKSKVFSLLNHSSYIIYLCHCLPIFLINDWVLAFGINDMGLSLIIRCTFVYGCMFIVSLIYSYYRKLKTRLHLFHPQ